MSSYFPGGSDSKEFACNAEEFACNAGEFAGMECLIPELGRYPGEEHGDPLLYSCLENPHESVPGVLQSMGSQTQT